MWFSSIAVPFSCFKLARFRSVGLNFEYKISKFRRWRETVTVATASCVRAYENLDLHSSPVLLKGVYTSAQFNLRWQSIP